MYVHCTQYSLSRWDPITFQKNLQINKFCPCQQLLSDDDMPSVMTKQNHHHVMGLDSGVVVKQEPCTTSSSQLSLDEDNVSYFGIQKTISVVYCGV